MQGKLAKMPTWVVLLAATVFAVLMTAAVVRLYARGFLPIAGPFVVVAWAPLLVWVQLTGVRNRARRRHRVLTEKLGNLSRLISAERNQPPGARSSAATDRSLAEAGSLVQTALGLLAENRAEAVMVVGGLGEMSARWLPDAPLTQSVVQTVAAAQKLTLGWARVTEVRSRT